MAYTSNGRRTAQKRNGNGLASKRKSASVDLVLQANDTYQCSSNKTYTDSFTITQELDNQDGFITLSSTSKDIGQLSVYTAKVIILKNISNICAEVAITVFDWRDSSDTDVANSVAMAGGVATVLRTWTMLLPAGEFFYLPTSRIVGYSQVVGATLESAALAVDGRIGEALSGTNRDSSQNVADDLDNTTNPVTFECTSGNKYKVDDLIKVQDEIMKVTAISTNNLTVERGLFGTTVATHADALDIYFYFGNEYLKASETLCMTDQNGRFKQSGGYFGRARTDDKLADGIVAGSVAIGPFITEGGYLDWGLTGINPNDKTGLAASTAYTFHIIVDEFASSGFDGTSNEAAILFTPDASDTTWAGSSNAVLPKIQARFDALFYDATSTNCLFNKRVTISLHNGDVRVQSHSNNSNTRIGIGNVSGTTPFAVGRFPALSSSVPVLQGSLYGGGTTDTIVYGPISSYAVETIDDRTTGKTETNSNAFIFDDGKGNLLHNNTNVGWIDYEKGHLEFSHLPYAQFKINGQSNSAHAGGVSHVVSSYNGIESIRARSVNAKENTKIQLILLG